MNLAFFTEREIRFPVFSSCLLVAAVALKLLRYEILQLTKMQLRQQIEYMYSVEWENSKVEILVLLHQNILWEENKYVHFTVYLLKYSGVIFIFSYSFHFYQGSDIIYAWYFADNEIKIVFGSVFNFDPKQVILKSHKNNEKIYSEFENQFIL